MDLPSFIWLWRIAAWAMGLSLTVYVGLLVTGGGVWYGRSHQKSQLSWLRLVHIVLGVILLALVMVLLGIGIVGTLRRLATAAGLWCSSICRDVWGMAFDAVAACNSL